MEFPRAVRQLSSMCRRRSKPLASNFSRETGCVCGIRDNQGSPTETAKGTVKLLAARPKLDSQIARQVLRLEPPCFLNQRPTHGTHNDPGVRPAAELTMVRLCQPRKRDKLVWGRVARLWIAAERPSRSNGVRGLQPTRDRSARWRVCRRPRTSRRAHCEASDPWVRRSNRRPNMSRAAWLRNLSHFDAEAVALCTKRRAVEMRTNWHLAARASAGAVAPPSRPQVCG
jgi:hypothetical protein